MKKGKNMGRKNLFSSICPLEAQLLVLRLGKAALCYPSLIFCPESIHL